MQERISWDEYFIQSAELIARRSTCMRRQVGAVLVKDNRIIASGYNGAPSGIKHCGEREEGCLRMVTIAAIWNYGNDSMSFT